MCELYEHLKGNGCKTTVLLIIRNDELLFEINFVTSWFPFLATLSNAHVIHSYHFQTDDVQNISCKIIGYVGDSNITVSFLIVNVSKSVTFNSPRVAGWGRENLLAGRI